MPDVSGRRREVGTPTPSRFAVETRAPGTVQLPGSADTEPLTLNELDRARQMHGTAGADSAHGYYELMDKVFATAEANIEDPEALKDLLQARAAHGTTEADSTDGYYQQMDRVFAAARAGAVEPEEDRRERALTECAEAIEDETDIEAAEIVSFHDAVQYDEPGSTLWENSTRLWAEHILDLSVEDVRGIDARMRAAAAPQPDALLGGQEFNAMTLNTVIKREPAAVLSAAVGTEKDPYAVPRPEAMNDSGHVEVLLDADDVMESLDNRGYDTEDMDLDGYDEIYADATLTGNSELDIWGVKNGKESVIALGIDDEHLVNPDNSEYLNYRGNHTDPVPAHNEATRAWKAARRQAADTVLAEAGIAVEVDPVHPRAITLRRGTKTMQVVDDEYRAGGSPLIETRNWRKASPEDLSEFLGSEPEKDVTKMLILSARLSAAGKITDHYKENR